MPNQGFELGLIFFQDLENFLTSKFSVAVTVSVFCSQGPSKRLTRMEMARSDSVSWRYEAIGTFLHLPTRWTQKHSSSSSFGFFLTTSHYIQVAGKRHTFYCHYHFHYVGFLAMDMTFNNRGIFKQGKGFGENIQEHV